MGIENYESTPGNNTDAPPNGWPEGMAVSAVNNAARQMMADLASYRDDAAWINYYKDLTTGELLTYTVSDGDTFTIANASTPTDHTSRFHAGRRIRCVTSVGGTIYGFIASSSYSAPTTTVNITADSGSLSGSVTSISIGTQPVTNSAIPQASTTVSGKVELATDAETQTGTDTARAITPANLQACTATETRKGVAEIATQAEVDAGIDTERIIVPSKLKASLSAQGSKLFDPFARIDLSDDFIFAMTDSANSRITSQLTWETEATGTLASVSSPVATVVGGNPVAGYIYLDTGSTATGYAAIHSRYGGGQGSLVLALGEMTCEWLIRLPDLSTATEEYMVFCGFWGAETLASSTNGVYFRYNRLSSVNWQFVAENTGTESSSNSSIAVAADTWIKLKIVVNTNASAADFYIASGTATYTSVGQQTTNLPSSLTNLHCGCGILKSASAGASSFVYIDAFRFILDLDAAR